MSTNEHTTTLPAAPAYDDVAVVPTAPAHGLSSAAVAPSGKEEYPPLTRKVHWYRSTITQILVIGGVFFCAPGMYNALSGLGAGGLATPYWANATAAAGYVFMAFMCIVGGIIVSKLGVRWSLLVCGTGTSLSYRALTPNRSPLRVISSTPERCTSTASTERTGASFHSIMSSQELTGLQASTLR